MVAGGQNPFGQSQNPTMVATDVRGPVWSRASCLSGNVPETTAVSGIRLNTFPEDATISINSKRARADSKDLPNQYTVRAELPGFQPSETRVNVIAGYRQEITINLQAGIRITKKASSSNGNSSCLRPSPHINRPWPKTEFGVRLRESGSGLCEADATARRLICCSWRSRSSRIARSSWPADPAPKAR